MTRLLLVFAVLVVAGGCGVAPSRRSITSRLSSSAEVKAGTISAVLPANTPGTVIFNDLKPPQRLEMHIHD